MIPTCNIHSLSVDRKMYHGKRYPFSFRTLSLSANCPQKKVKENEIFPVVSDSLRPQFVEFFRPKYWSRQPFPSLGDLPNPGIEPRPPILQVDFLPAEPQGKPKNTGMGSLSLLQGIFPTQELNRGLLHCRQILYQMSYQGPQKKKEVITWPVLRPWALWILDVSQRYTNTYISFLWVSVSTVDLEHYD